MHPVFSCYNEDFKKSNSTRNVQIVKGSKPRSSKRLMTKRVLEVPVARGYKSIRVQDVMSDPNMTKGNSKNFHTTAFTTSDTDQDLGFLNIGCAVMRLNHHIESIQADNEIGEESGSKA